MIRWKSNRLLLFFYENLDRKLQSYTDEDLKFIVGALPLDQRQKMEKLLRDKRRNSEFKILLDPQNRKDVPSWVSEKH